MRVAVVGGGPAGLYFAYLWKTRHPEAQIDLFEQNAADTTWGFGVVFSDRAWEFLQADDPETADFLSPHLESWSNMTIYHAGERIEIDGVGFSAVGRLRLLNLLQQRARAAGVRLHFSTAITSIDQFAGHDLVVAADGLNSVVRRSFETGFKTSIQYSDNKFAWYGTSKRFDTLSQTFVQTELGTFNAHHYRYSPSMSTFLIECDRDTWERYGFANRTIDESRALCEQIFAQSLDGHGLISNNSIWRSFPWLWSERWSYRNMVLLGDALHTAHFSIGSGTRLAMEDAVALVKALEAEAGNLPAGLHRYEQERRPIVETLVSAARASADWYEHFPEHMKLDPLDFAYSYITRSGRIDDARLRVASPSFMAQFEASKTGRQSRDDKSDTES